MTVTLIELNNFHEECLYSQVKFLHDQDITVNLIVNSSLRIQVEEYKCLINDIQYFNRKKKIKILDFFKIYKYLISSQPDIVVFNTGSSKLDIVGLSNFLPKKIKRFGILHNLTKLFSSKSQVLISKGIDGYFVINDFLLKNDLIAQSPKPFYSFYPVFFPKYKDSFKILKTGQEFWFCIPGSVSYKRKDYKLLIDIAAQLKAYNNFKFIILGKMNPDHEDAADFIKKIKENDVADKFTLFDQFIPNPVFHEYISNSDCLLLPFNKEHNSYINYKITGAINLAIAHQKKIITSSDLKIIDDIVDNGFFYNDPTELLFYIKEIISGNRDLSFVNNPKWSFEHQQKQYLSALGITVKN